MVSKQKIKRQSVSSKNSTNPGESYLNYFKPLEVIVKNYNDDFDSAHKAFKALVQREKVISLYKEHQRYEKPSDKKRRKRKEAQEKRLAMAHKAKLIESGEWNKIVQRKRRDKEE